MKTQRSVINKNYQNILKQKTGAEFIKADLHVHTPASGDAQWKSRYNFKWDKKDTLGSLNAAKQLAGEIVDGVIEKGIRLIAVTDHNTPSNTDPEELTHTWYELLKDKADGKELTVLPGVEISTDDLHILVILDPRENEPVANIIHRINFLLRDCKFSLKDFGDFKATGGSSLFDVLQYLEGLGASCLAIPAHIDGGNKALLEVYEKPGNIYTKLLNHPNLNVVEVVKYTTPTKKKMGKEPLKDYFSRMRDKDRSPIAFIRDSDAHRTKDIGKRFTYIRMGEPGFWPLKNALENPETRVRMDKDFKPETGKTTVRGIAFSTGGKWSYISFNNNLNCIIGKKQTRKSTVINLILFGLGQFQDEEKDEEALLMKKKYSVNVFISRGPDIYCYSRDNKGNPPDVFKYNGNSFSPVATKPDIELPRKYNHQIVDKLFTQSTYLMDFLDRHVFVNDKMKKYMSDRKKYFEKVKKANFTDCASDMERLVKACGKLFDERKKQIEPTLKKYGKDLFKVDVPRRKWTGTNEEDYLDKAEMSVLVKSKYKSIKKLSTGERNGVMMVLLMNQGAFGPLIIDEPEVYLDTLSITGMLVPRMRELKTQQQIICVTRDEHILISGDAEQVIVTLSNKKLDATTGDINNKAIQEHVLEIFEGDKGALSEKVRKLGQIM